MVGAATSSITSGLHASTAGSASSSTYVAGNHPFASPTIPRSQPFASSEITRTLAPSSRPSSLGCDASYAVVTLAKTSRNSTSSLRTDHVPSTTVHMRVVASGYVRPAHVLLLIPTTRSRSLSRPSAGPPSVTPQMRTPSATPSYGANCTPYLDSFDGRCSVTWRTSTRSANKPPSSSLGCAGPSSFIMSAMDARCTLRPMIGMSMKVAKASPHSSACPGASADKSHSRAGVVIRSLGSLISIFCALVSSIVPLSFFPSLLSPALSK
mmetsp:Transcript_35320/g.92372  ORF Transcript_35320/g.92372 Transcript_35320/m.92372 type:complete len:267 (+) Transcript_35320:579-1379(+)